MTPMGHGRARHATEPSRPRGNDGPRSGGPPYFPALDGLRALAMAAILSFHLGWRVVGGGYLALDLYFVLSGFLITEMLVAEHERSGRIRLRAFWGRRARRLLPGLFTMLAAVTLFTIADPSAASPAQVRSDGIPVLFYFANWHFLSVSATYFGKVGNPSPLRQTWSLAIEEQFYLVWPLVLLGLLALRERLARRRGRAPGAGCLLGATAILVALSAASMALVYDGGRGLDAAYYGTEARMFEILVGAGVAVALRASRRGDLLRGLQHTRDRRLQAAGLAALGLVVAGFLLASGPPAWVFEGGFLAFSLASATLMVGAIAPGPVRWLFSLRPVRWLGRVTYEIYLWHWPIIVLLRPAVTGLHGLVSVAFQVGLTLLVAAATHRFVNEPLRHASYAGLRRLLLPAAVGALASLLLVAAPFAVPAPPTAAALVRAEGDAAGSDPTFGVVLPPPVGHVDLGRAPSRTHPLRVMYLGDSVMYQLELALAAGLDSTGEVETAAFEGVPGWGMTHATPPWSRFIAAARRSHPQVVVAMWTQDNAWVASHGVRAYEALLGRFLAELLAPATGVRAVIFVGQPPQPPADSFMALLKADVYSPAGAAMWKETVLDEVRRLPGRVAFVPAGRMLALGGRYAAYLPGPDGELGRLRQVDDFHLCLNGAIRYGAGALHGLVELLGLRPPAPRWWAGSWTGAVRFDHLPGYPPGECPDPVLSVRA
jgi:peptidoglycan/LPS O-acetylase OafA/YrhL